MIPLRDKKEFTVQQIGLIGTTLTNCLFLRRLPRPIRKNISLSQSCSNIFLDIRHLRK